MIVALDLDRTLIHHPAPPAGSATPEDELSVERVDGRDVSVIGEGAATMLQQLADLVTVVPVTSRALSEYRRLTLPIVPGWAIVANGGVILRDDQPDRDWAVAVARRLADGTSVSAMAVNRRLHVLSGRPGSRLTAIRTVDELFVRAAHPLGDEPAGWPEFVRQLAPQGWRAWRTATRLYVMPIPLTKQAALEYVIRIAAEPLLAAAGDSELDRQMLAMAPHRYVPRGSELAAATAPVAGAWTTANPGVRATTEILTDLLRIAGDGAGARPNV